jgi:hypothetical protein
VIEKDLTRIAVALETIAAALVWKNEFMVANHQTLPVDAVQELDTIEQSISDLENQKREFLEKETAEVVDSLPFAPKLPEVKETPVLHDTIGTGKTVEETPAAPEIKFEEVSKAFFDLLNRVKEAEGLDEAKSIATELISRYNNGKPISLATLPKESYVPLMAEIEKGRASYEPA